MEDNNTNQMLIVSSIEEKPEKGLKERGRLGEALKKGAMKAVDVSILKHNMGRFFDQLREILNVEGNKIGAFEVEEVEVSAQISGDGKVGLLGAEAKIGTQGGIKFVLKRTKKQQ